MEPTTTELRLHQPQALTLIKPQPRAAVSIRTAQPGGQDLAFIDSLQKLHSKMVGWLPTKQLETNIERGNVLIAEESDQPSAISDLPDADSRPLDADRCSGKPIPLGYCIARDQYFKHDDVGIIYQLNVLPNQHRSLIGATLVKAVFERAAYGCKLFCCWCAQDLDANHFWEAMGFVPLAFRTGSRRNGRIHIFWQCRIREGDTGPGATPWWFPSQTTGGAIRENRLVIPIPPGTHWRDAKPLILPGMDDANGTEDSRAENDEGTERARSSRRRKRVVIGMKQKSINTGGLRFQSPEEQADQDARLKRAASKATRKRRRPTKTTNDPKHVAAARDLRDRFLEAVQRDPSLLLEHGKYDVRRALPETAPHALRITATPLPEVA